MSTLPRRFGIILEKILDRHERSGIAAQWNGGFKYFIPNFTFCEIYARSEIICSLHSKPRSGFEIEMNFICFTVEKSGTGVRLQINYMSRVARKRFIGVHAPDSPACVHVDTENKH